ncbi:MAG: polysaccharide biosynthesis protein [Bacteroidales bacterium]|nr:polysaccharide biosynthesis protein [Bacteroidales bacterium]
MRLFEKRIKDYLNTYLNTRVVFAVDVIVSTLASFFALFVLFLIVRSTPYPKVASLVYFACSFFASGFASVITRNYRVIIRHANTRDFGRLLMTIILKILILTAIFVLIPLISENPSFEVLKRLLTPLILGDLLFSILFLFGVRFLMMVAYSVMKDRINKKANRKNILIYGTKSKATSIITLLSNSDTYNILGLITKDPTEKDAVICGFRTFYFDDNDAFLQFARNNELNAILYAHLKDAQAEANELVAICNNFNIKSLTVPSIDTVKSAAENRQDSGRSVRAIEIEDLLGREEITLDISTVRNNFEGKVIMVTGAAGSIGSELCRQLAAFGVSHLIMFDNAETPMHNLKLELQEKFPHLRFTSVIGDVRLRARLDYAFKKFRPQVVFHAAAYKHVPLMEENPCEAVFVNAVGTRYVADKCVEYDVEKMVMISTDKAVNPTNIMGCTKRLAEIYVQALGNAIETGKKVGKTKFVTTRFGNVLGSNGSVIPLFRKQIENGGPVTVTHPDITRFFMSIPEACRLVMAAASMPLYNKIFVFDMGDPIHIDTFARNMIKLAGYKPDVDIKVVYSGLRPGEKLYEEVLNEAEKTDATEHSKIRIAKILPEDYDKAFNDNLHLEVMSRKVDVAGVVKLMKQLVPEFKSNNPQFKTDEES